MHISDVHDYGSQDQHDATTKPYLEKVQRDALKSEIEQIIDIEFERLGDYANDYISDVAAERAEKFLERVLKGDDDAAMSLLGDKSDGDRIRLGGCDHGKPWAHLIHGSLFETGGIALRRQIVDTHAELLKSERIKDLESVVEGLSRQVRDLENRLDDHRNA